MMKIEKLKNNSYRNHLFVIVPVILAGIFLWIYYNQPVKQAKPQVQVQLTDGSIVTVDKIPNESLQDLEMRAKNQPRENTKVIKSTKNDINLGKIVEYVLFIICTIISIVLLFLIFLIVPHYSGLEAERKGYSYWVWFWCAFFFNIGGYLICMLVLSALPNRKIAEEKEFKERLSRYPCPECGEPIKKQARICCFCNAVLTPKDTNKFKKKVKNI